jgi:peptide/nickel transport system permease protein
LYGLRSSWFASLALVGSGLLVGAVVGVTAGAAGGIIDGILMRICDLFLALPATILAIAVVAAIGPSLFHTLLALGIVWWAYYARIIRSEILALAARPHVEAARLAGAKRIRLAWRHLLPGAVPVMIVTASLDIGVVVVTLALLSFVGLGAPPPTTELGSMAAQGVNYLLAQWWIPILPGVAVMFLALLANLCGDGVRNLFTDR